MPWQNAKGENYETRGEAFLDRHLRTENREGVDHYVPGQALAQREGEKAGGMSVARLSYCTAFGAVSLAVIKQDGGDWEIPIAKFRVVGLEVDYGIRDLPEDFELSDEHKAALAKLEESEG